MQLKLSKIDIIIMDATTEVRTTINLLVNMSVNEKKKYLKSTKPKCLKKIVKLLRILKSLMIVRKKTVKEKPLKVPTRKKVMEMKRKKVMKKKLLPKRRNQKLLFNINLRSLKRAKRRYKRKRLKMLKMDYLSKTIQVKMSLILVARKLSLVI